MAAARSQRVSLGSLLAARTKGRRVLRDHGFHDPLRAATTLRRLYDDTEHRRNLAKLFPHLLATCAQSADPDRALVGFARLVAALPNAGMFYRYLHAAPDRLALLVRIFAHSLSLADTLARNANHLHFLINPQTLALPRTKTQLAIELNRLLLLNRLPTQQYEIVRRFRRRETLRIGARDLLGRASVEETTLELSNLADVCLDAVLDIARRTLRAQYQLSTRTAPLTSTFAIIGMGKLGGQELNYSSDVDLMFIYGEDADLKPGLTCHEFFTKLAEAIIHAVAAPGIAGTIFRIDLRLRPEGAAGPLARALDSYETYYAQQGETWERMALIKARHVAGDLVVTKTFLETVQPFVFPRHAGDQVIQQMAAIKQRIESEIVREDRLTRHVKLGIGGIREIEFIAQSFQVLRGARQPLLRNHSTLPTLAVLAQLKVLSAADADTLADAYRFLRNVEHRLQMEMDLQTHTIPDEHQALARLARSLGFTTVPEFQRTLAGHTAGVRAIYDAMLARAAQTAAQSTESALTPDKLPSALAAAGFADVTAAGKRVEQLLHGPGFIHVSQRTMDLFALLFPTLLDWLAKVADPDAALAQFDRFLTAYGSRGLMYETLASHPRLVEMLVRLGDASRFLADNLAREPDLFDEICRGATLSEPKSLARLETELQTAVASSHAPSQPAAALDAARHWHRRELFRIGLEDVLGLVDVEQFQQELTWLAEACLRLAVAHTQRQLGLKRLPFAVIGLGKLGGQEIGYGADLDVLFVGGRSDADHESAVRLAAGVMDFMERQTAAGVLFRVDPRLRPDGEKGPLANTLAAHEDYYRKRAQFWEKQALVKARCVAGDARLAQQFLAMTHSIIYARPPAAAEITEAQQMRWRVETERGDPRHLDLEFKTGAGGLMDVEFLVQVEQLRHGPTQPHVRTAHTLAALNRLSVLGVVDDETSYQLRRGYLFLRRIESVLRRQENTSLSHIPIEPREQALLARRLGFATTTEFLNAYTIERKLIRGAYREHIDRFAPECGSRPRQ